MVKRSDYTARAVEAARSVLLELGHVLGQYRQHIVLVGGGGSRFFSALNRRRENVCGGMPGKEWTTF